MSRGLRTKPLLVKHASLGYYLRNNRVRRSAKQLLIRLLVARECLKIQKRQLIRNEVVALNFIILGISLSIQGLLHPKISQT